MYSKFLIISLITFRAIGLAVPIETSTSLAIRSPGTIAQYVDATEVIRRDVNVALVAQGLSTIAAITYTACTTTAPIVPVLAATTCLLAAVSTFAAGLFVLWRGLKGRDLTLHSDGGMVYTIGNVEYKTYFHQLAGGPSVLSQLQANYTGSPILFAHHTCEESHCFEAYYSHHYNSKQEIVHKFSASPRSATVKKRNNLIVRATDYNETGSANDAAGDLLYVDYTFQNMNNADEATEGNDPGFENEFYNLIGNESSYTTQGYKCLSVLDADDGNAVGAQGYITIVQDYQIADPDHEAEYIASCA